jgi:hypothetical protein
MHGWGPLFKSGAKAVPNQEQTTTCFYIDTYRDRSAYWWVILLQYWELMQEYLFHSTKQVVSCHGKARMEQASVSKWDTNSIPASEGVNHTFHGELWMHTA